MVKYFHELTEKEYAALVAQGNMTYQELAEKYPQPEWCTYPNAVMGIMGCWSLISHMVAGEDYCLTCDCHKNAQKQKRGTHGLRRN